MLDAKKGGIVHVRMQSEAFRTEGLQIARMRGEEQLNGLFSFELDMTEVAQDELLPVDLQKTTTEMLGARASLVFERDGVAVRTVHGMISAVEEAIDTRADKAGEAGAFRATLVPRFFQSSLVCIHEVFLDLSIPEILTKKLANVELVVGADVELRLGGAYPKREFVVQYKETDLAFITRLCEYYGITYFFDHEGEVEKLVFVDRQSSFEVSEPRSLGRGEGDEVIKWVKSHSRCVPGVRVMTDYNPVNPALELKQSAEVPGGFQGGVVDLVGKFKSQEQGTPLAGVRAEETECHRVVLRGQSGCVSFRPGLIVPIAEAPTLADPTFLITSIEHQITQQAGLLGANDELQAYVNTFHATRGATQFRPRLLTHQPKVHGVVTAFVEEHLASGQYAVLDDRGRYWVRFEFDAGEHAAKHSLPIRMMQPHAGASYGMHLPLKRGTEVMVAFLDGDVDRPVIVGSVPNELTQSPVNRSNYQINKLLKTETGIVIEARDVWPPEAPSLQQVPEE
jgi:type VI secretion system secreted protein VgrG